MTASHDHTARIWTAEGTLLRKLEGHRGEVAGASFSPDGTKILTGVDGLIARVWDAKTGARIAHLLTQSSTVTDVAWSPDSRFVAVAEPQGSVGVLKVASKAVATRLSGNFYGGAWSVDFKRCPSIARLLRVALHPHWLRRGDPQDVVTYIEYTPTSCAPPHSLPSGRIAALASGVRLMDTSSVPRATMC